MNTRSILALALGAFVSLGTTAAACKYCMSAENAEVEYQRQVVAAQANTPTGAPGAFPLDAAISQFTAPASLATPPPAGSVVTSAADLRAARPAAPSAVPALTPIAASASTVVAKPANHFADAGLLGLAAAGGVFCWRTRRKSGAER